ncbi:MAG: potassium-transporting ATPase subunit KdpA, partial [Candidatus Omnitrophota bacterium]
MIRELLEVSVFSMVLIALAIPLGMYLGMVFKGQRTFMDSVVGSLEKFLYKLFGVDPNEEMNWKTYTWNLVVFTIWGFIVLFLIQVFQNRLPFNPQHFPALSWHLAINTAVSFATNTNWQAYGGETTMSYFTQMFGLTVQNFLSAAAGMAACVALLRGFVRHSTEFIGNFWSDLSKSVLYVLLPLSIMVSLVLVSQGVVQTMRPYI